LGKLRQKEATDRRRLSSPDFFSALARDFLLLSRTTSADFGFG